MTARQGVRRVAPAWVPAAVAAGFMLLVWASGNGSVDVFDASGRKRSDEPLPVPSGSPSDTPVGPPALSEVTEDVDQTLDLSWLGDLITWAIVLAVAFIALIGLRWAWENRWRPPDPAPEVEFEALPVRQLAERLTEDAAARRAAIAEGDPRNGIVRCWIMLQDSIAEAGVPSRPSETSAEFTVRVLHELDLDPRAIEQLARLYREARFSTHQLGEDARARATAALETLHADLETVRA